MDEMSPRQKVATVEKVKVLEGQLAGGDAADGVVTEINELRHALGWLEIGADGQWRWPSLQMSAPEGSDALPSRFSPTTRPGCAR